MPTATKLRFSEFIDLILARLHELENSSGGSGKFFDVNLIAKELAQPVPISWIFDAGKVLESRGLIRAIFAMGGTCLAQLTGEGRLYVENEQGTGIIKQYHESPQNFVVVNVSGNHNQIVAGHNSGAVNQTLTIEQEREPAFQLLQEIERQLKSDASLESHEKDDLLADVAMIRGQLKKREPNRPALAALLEPLSQVASVAGFVANLIQLLNP